MPTVKGSGTNSNINEGGQRIETRVLAPPGGFSNVSFGGEETQSQKFGGHNFNPKSQKSEEKETSASLTSQVEPEPESKSVAVPQQQAPPPVEDKAEQTAAKQDFRGRGGSSGGGTSSITFG